MKYRIVNGFTLIELLVVIAIISLLVSILLPSLNKARELAKDVVCRSNVRSIGLGINLYSADNDGNYPLSPVEVFYTLDSTPLYRCAIDSHDEWKQGSLYVLFRDGMLDAPDIVFCPANAGTNKASKLWPDLQWSCYWSNYAYLGSSENCWMTVLPQGRFLVDALPQNAHDSSDAPDAVLLADCYDTAYAPTVDLQNHQRRGSNILYNDLHVEWLDTRDDDVQSWAAIRGQALDGSSKCSKWFPF